MDVGVPSCPDATIAGNVRREWVVRILRCGADKRIGMPIVKRHSGKHFPFQIQWDAVQV